jgi:hypothetical protein
MYSKSKKKVRRSKRKTLKMRKNKKIQRRYKKTMRGGSYGLPSVFGSPYNAAELLPKGNYYPYNPNVEQWPEQSNGIFRGGRGTGAGRRRTKKGKHLSKKQKGGGITEFVTTLLPEEVVNIGRSFPAGLGHMYDKFNGALSLPSSMVYPTQQPYVTQTAASANRSMSPPDILNMYNTSNGQVANY